MRYELVHTRGRPTMRYELVHTRAAPAAPREIGVTVRFDACTLGIVPHRAAAIMGLAALLHPSAVAFQTSKYPDKYPDVAQPAGVGVERA